MKNYFPNQNGYLQTNRSDRLGSIWSSFNLDFQNKLGTLKLSDKLVTTTTGASIGLASSFDYYYGGWYGIIGNKIYRSSSLTSAFEIPVNNNYLLGDSTTQFDITNPTGTTFRYTYDGTGTNPDITALTVPIGALVAITAENFDSVNNIIGTITGSGNNYFEVTNASGIIESDKTIGTGSIKVKGETTFGQNCDPQKSDTALFNGYLWFTEKTKLNYINNIDTSTAERLLDDSLHKLLYFKKFNRLYYTNNKTTIKSIDENNTIASSSDYYLNIGNNSGEITTMVANSQNIWIATLMPDSATGVGQYGSIYQWDGISSQPTQEYKLNTAGVLAMCILNDIPYAIDTQGRILKYTGYSFEEIQRLPIDRRLLTQTTTTTGTSRFIHYNGMVSTKDNTILFSINNLNAEDDISSNENLPSGVWELDLATGNFTHKYSFTYKPYNSATITDFGQNRVSAVGVIKINPLNYATSAGRSTLLAGVTYYTDATTTTSVVCIDSPYKPDTDYEGQKRGYFVTTWFESREVTDNFKRLWAIFKKFTSNNGKIIFKYRLKEEDPIEATITWVNTTSFTTTTDVSDYIGYEAEIIQGTGSGSCNNITNVTEDGGTYTVTIDTAVTGVTGTAKARFQKWIKLVPEFTGESFSYGQAEITENDIQIQIKGILEWTGDCEFVKMILDSEEFTKS